MSQFAGMMEHAGHAVAEAANEQEAAEHFLPLVGLAAKFVLPKLAGLAAKKVGRLAAKKWGTTFKKSCSTSHSPCYATAYSW